MSYVVLDFETYYDKDYSLRKMTPVEYILDPRFDVIGCAFKHSDGTKPFWLDAPTLEGYLPGLARRGPLTVVSHNALFDMCILAWKYGVVPHLIIDTMAMSRALLYAFVGKVSLEAIADHLKLPPKGTAIKHVSGMNADAIKSAGLWDTYTAYAIHDAWLCEQIFLKLASPGYARLLHRGAEAGAAGTVRAGRPHVADVEREVRRGATHAGCRAAYQTLARYRADDLRLRQVRPRHDRAG
jgi:hypothetical protein